MSMAVGLMQSRHAVRRRRVLVKHWILSLALASCMVLPATALRAAPNWPIAPYSYSAKNDSRQSALRQCAGGFSLAVDLAPGVQGTANGKFNPATPTEFIDKLGGGSVFNWCVYSGTLYASPASAMVTRAVSAMGSSI